MGVDSCRAVQKTFTASRDSNASRVEEYVTPLDNDQRLNSGTNEDGKQFEVFLPEFILLYNTLNSEGWQYDETTPAASLSGQHSKAEYRNSLEEMKPKRLAVR
jgi:hypothetical protein